VGAQAQLHLLDIGWGVNAAVRGSNPSAEVISLAGLLNVSEGDLTDGSRSFTYGFGAGLTVRADIAEDFNILARIGVEGVVHDAVALKLSDGTPNKRLSADGFFSAKSVISPAGFIGYKGLYLGFVYDMREYDTPLHNNMHVDAYLNSDDKTSGGAFAKTIKDNQFLFGFRGETEYDIGGAALIIGLEGLSNIGSKSDSSTKDYFNSITEAIGLVDGEGLDANNNVESTLVQRALYSDVTKLSLTLGFLFEDL